MTLSADPYHRPPSAPLPLTGGCQCGHVRYALDGPFGGSAHCHCTDCRAAHGAPFVTWTTVAWRGFRLTAGAPTWRRSSPRAARAFCPRCGTPLLFRADAWPDEVDVATATLDHPDAVTPDHHLFVGSALPWVCLNDGLPRHVADSASPRLDSA
ncbi:GFA family protein [Roseospirillum parvum]|uniref:Uncharacterized conserved protein n=1 Tax=Roseospirillum parvum TaxID=83401 RepID=A0A1G8CXZ9_9PROT|nr:GFA family protein [Roseospirillum parvum]SDH49820.1 Uncharacterized conserved protein [Roseospirillum parvum]